MGNRPEHFLKPIKSSTIPNEVIFVDTETTQHGTDDDRVYHKLMLGVAMYLRMRRDNKPNRKVIKRFDTIEQFWEFVFSRKRKKTVLYLVSHNATFDFTVLQASTNLEKGGYNCKFIYEGGVRFISKWRTKDHTIVILDNSNWFAGKLSRWGDELGMPKLEMPSYDMSKDEWYTYCERDTEILYQLFIWYTDFLRDNDLGKWQFTIASSAFTAYRHRFMSHPIYIPDEDSESDIARKAYHGGRTECFKVGKFNGETFYKIDVHSMYPYVMREYQYPTRFMGRYDDVKVDELKPALDKGCAIADVTVNATQPYFCTTVNNRNVYPIGRFRTVLTTPELALGVKNDWIEKVHDIAIYRKRPIFQEYVDFFYGIKVEATQEGKRLMRAFAKLYLNSLYGKFGQRGYVDKEMGQDDVSRFRVMYGINADTGQRFVLRQVGKDMLYSEREGEGYNAFCAIAAHVTAYARLYLYKTVIACGRENTYYCDTDSIICNELGYNRVRHMVHESRLGAWGIEGISSTMEIVAPKHYTFDNKTKMKGVSHDAEQIAENTFKQEIWPGLNTILKEGDERYFNYYMIKHLNPEIISGTVENDGTVVPFMLNR